MAKTQTSEFDQVVSRSAVGGLWGLLRGFRLTYAGAIGSLAVSTAARTGTFFLIGYLVDQVLTSDTMMRDLPWVAAGFIALALTEGAFTFTSGRLAARAAEGIALKIRNYFYDHIQRLTFAFHDKMPTGDLIQRATSDVEAVRKFYAEQAIGVGRIVLLFLVNFIAVLTINRQLAVLSVIVVPVIITISIFFFRRVSKAYGYYQEQDAVLSTTLQENLTGVRVVKAFARQQYEMDKFERDNSEKFRRGKKLLIMHSLFWPSADILCSAQMIAGFAIGALMVMNQTLTMGEYVTYMGLVVLLIWPMRELGRMVVQASTGIVSFGRLAEIIRLHREPIEHGVYMPTTDERVRGEIVFRNVGFEYEKEHRVLRDISFHAKPGEVIALMGPTGSGKTSLVNLLPRFYEYEQGSIQLDGVELNEYPREYLRRQIGIVEQEPFLFSRTLRENITYGVGREVSDDEVFAAARAAAVHDVILAFPDGYNTLVGEKGITLSGGQKQRVTIARTILKNPRILILDDSTSAVDTETEQAIRDALQALMRDRTTFIIAHRIQSVMSADQIFVLEKGRITQRGAHRELLKQDGLYKKIYELQARIESEVEAAIADEAGAPVSSAAQPYEPELIPALS
ncbi:MAG: putative ABC transporter ATP-binding protein [Anaerolineae bacterium]|nr:putative ABC transporter ATP-binding protein [Anaerolineae bacterium]